MFSFKKRLATTKLLDVICMEVKSCLLFVEKFSCFNGGTPTVGESGSGDTSDEYQLFIYCVCTPEYTGEMCEKGYNILFRYQLFSQV